MLCNQIYVHFLCNSNTRDFANGFLFAEIISRYYPSDIAMHAFDNVASVERKKKNWALLERFFKVRQEQEQTCINRTLDCPQFPY